MAKTVPTIAEIQSFIDEKGGLLDAVQAAPATVEHVLLCYTRTDGFDLYAVTDGEGGVAFEMGDVTFITVSKNAPTVRDLACSWIGEIVPSGQDLILFAGTAGMEFPSRSACEAAIEASGTVKEGGAALRKSFAEIGVQLKTALDDLSGVRSLCAEFPDLAEAANAVDADARALGEIGKRLRELMQFPEDRRVETLLGDIARESEAIARLRRELDSCLEISRDAMQGARDRYKALDAERRRQAQWLEAERARVARLYIEALRAPLPIDYSAARQEFDEVARLLDSGPDDRDTLRRRLLALRLRGLRSVTEGGVFGTHFEALIEQIDDRLGAVTRTGDGSGAETAPSGAGSGAEQLSLDIW